MASKVKIDCIIGWSAGDILPVVLIKTDGDWNVGTPKIFNSDQIKAAFKHEFFAPSGRIAHNDMTSWGLAFLSGFVPPEYYEAGKKYFRRMVEDADSLIGTGFIGTPA